MGQQLRTRPDDYNRIFGDLLALEGRYHWSAALKGFTDDFYTMSCLHCGAEVTIGVDDHGCYSLSATGIWATSRGRRCGLRRKPPPSSHLDATQALQSVRQRSDLADDKLTIELISPGHQPAAVTANGFALLVDLPIQLDSAVDEVRRAAATLSDARRYWTPVSIRRRRHRVRLRRRFASHPSLRPSGGAFACGAQGMR